MGRFVLECIFASLLEASAYVPRNDDNICILYEKRRAFSYFPLKNRWFQPPKDFMSRLTFFREVDSSMLAEKLRVIVTFLSNSFFLLSFYISYDIHTSIRKERLWHEKGISKADARKIRTWVGGEEVIWCSNKKTCSPDSFLPSSHCRLVIFVLKKGDLLMNTKKQIAWQTTLVSLLLLLFVISHIGILS